MFYPPTNSNWDVRFTETWRQFRGVSSSKKLFAPNLIFMGGQDFENLWDHLNSIPRRLTILPSSSCLLNLIWTCLESAWTPTIPPMQISSAATQSIKNVVKNPIERIFSSVQWSLTRTVTQMDIMRRGIVRNIKTAFCRIWLPKMAKTWIFL